MSQGSCLCGISMGHRQLPAYVQSHPSLTCACARKVRGCAEQGSPPHPKQSAQMAQTEISTLRSGIDLVIGVDLQLIPLGMLQWARIDLTIIYGLEVLRLLESLFLVATVKALPTDLTSCSGTIGTNLSRLGAGRQEMQNRLAGRARTNSRCG